MAETDETDEPTVACTLTEAEVEARREQNAEALVPHFEGAEELENGYRLRFEGSSESLAAVAAFVGREAECCSFASFRIEYEPPYGEVGLSFTGPEGTRDLLREGFLEAFDEVPTPP